MTTEAVGEGKVSGNQASIPADIRNALDIEDGDVLRWRLEEGGLHLEVVRRRDRVFEGYEPGESEEPTDAVRDHDAFGTSPRPSPRDPDEASEGDESADEGTERGP